MGSDTFKRYEGVLQIVFRFDLVSLLLDTTIYKFLAKSDFRTLSSTTQHAIFFNQAKSEKKSDLALQVLSAYSAIRYKACSW